MNSGILPSVNSHHLYQWWQNCASPMMNRRDKFSAQQDAQPIGPKASQLLQEQESSSQTFTTVLLAAVVSLAVVVCVLFAQLRAGDYPPHTQPHARACRRSQTYAAAVASAKTRNRTRPTRAFRNCCFAQAMAPHPYQARHYKRC